MQVRDLALQARRSGAGQLRGRIEVDEAELLAERHVIERLERELRRSAPAPQLDVRRRIRTVGNRRVQQIRQSRQESRRARRQGTASRASPAPSSSPSEPTSLFSASTSPPAALARPIAFERSLRVWRRPSTRHLKLLALRFEREVTLAIELEAAPREIRRHGVEVLAQGLGIEHRASLANVARRADTSPRAAAATTRSPRPRRRNSPLCRTSRTTACPSRACSRSRPTPSASSTTAIERVQAAPIKAGEPHHQHEVRARVHDLVVDARRPPTAGPGKQAADDHRRQRAASRAQTKAWGSAAATRRLSLRRRSRRRPPARRARTRRRRSRD